VSRILAGRINAVMTGCATCRYAGMVEIRRHKSVGSVAIIAIVATGNMGRALADGDRVVMAGAASTDYLRMIDPIGRGPLRNAMAVFAHTRRLNMVGLLARRVAAVVASTTTTRDIRVIEVCRHKGIGRMAGIATIATRQMRGVLADRNYVVMTGLTRTDNLCVIDSDYRLPKIWRMAFFAEVCRLNMLLAPAGRFIAVMAIETATDDAAVVKHGGDPCRRLVTIVTLVT